MSSNVWFPENLYVEWLMASFVLMTTSLLFYHMTRVKSLEMNSKISGIFAVTLILISVILAGVSIVPYYERISSAVENPTPEETPKEMKRENTYKILYTTLGCCLMVIQLCIAFAIIVGTFIRKK